jgi:hypothetical protein
MWWQTVLSVITFGIYSARKARRQEAKDKAHDWQDEAVKVRRELERKTEGKRGE